MEVEVAARGVGVNSSIIFYKVSLKKLNLFII
jgi:hypothetical protein